MKILVCVSEYPPHASGIGNVAYRMVKEFEKRGHSCTVCSLSGPDIVLGSRGMFERFGGLGLIHFWWRVSRHFADKGTKWDGVWLHGPLFIGRCPFPGAVVTFHTTYKGYRDMARNQRSSVLLRAYYAFMEMAERRSLRALNGSRHLFTVVSKHVSLELKAEGVRDRDISYISVGADLDKFHPVFDKAGIRRELNVPEEALVLLYVGRLTRQKNLFSLVDMFGEFKKRLGQGMLLMVGSGELENELRRYVQDKGAADVRLLGFVPNDELPRLYACADGFIMSSKYEGQPVVLLEAMAAGLPPIVSNIPVMESLVTESGAGIVVDFDDPVQAATKVLEYVLSPRLQEDGRVAREHVQTNMSSSLCAEKYLELMMQVSQKPSDAAGSKS